MTIELTYTSLYDQMTGYAEDTESSFLAEIPNMISRAELRCLRDLDLQHFEGWEGITISALDQFVDKPTDAVVVHEIWYDQGTGVWDYALKRTQSFCRAYWNINSSSSSPEYFAEVGNEATDGLFIVPTPNQTYTTAKAKALCTIRPTGLSASNDDSWLSSHVPDLLFEACMVEVYDYLKNPAKLEEAANKYQSLIAGVLKELENSITRRYTLGAQNG